VCSKKEGQGYKKKESMNHVEPDETKWQRRIDEIDSELGSVEGNDAALENEKQSLQSKIDARDEYDNNEQKNMSSTEDTVNAGRPSSNPLNKLKDRINGQTPEPDNNDPRNQQQHEDHQRQQSMPEPDEPQNNDHSNDAGGIRTIPVVEVKVQAGPHVRQQQPSTNQQQPQQMRSLGRQTYHRAYMNTPDVWQYPGSRHDTDQRGLVQQSYKSYFGLV
jgi:hypothetical protein